MYRIAAALGPVDGVAIDRIAKEVTIGDCFVDTGKVLVDHAPGTECHMPHFRIAHLPFRQAHSHARCMNQGFGALRPEGLPGRRVSTFNGIVLAVIAVAEAIKNEQNKWFVAICNRVSHVMGSKVVNFQLILKPRVRLRYVQG